MECSDLGRTGIAGLERHHIINIDHHAGNRMYGALNWFDESAAACGEMVFDVIRSLGVPLTPEIATHIYLALLTDTGSFHHANITPRTFDICRQCVEAGVTPAVMARRVFDSNSFGKLKLIGALLDDMELADEGRLAILRLDDDMLAATGITHRELELGSVAAIVLGIASIVYGALQAISRRDTSEVMAYSAIGQVGYVILAVGIGGPVGYAAAVLYSIVNSLNKGVIFLAAGLRGPLVGGAFAVGAFSIAGVPPAAGFVGKIAVFKAAIAEGSSVTAAAMVVLIFVGSALSFLYSFQVYQRRFLAPQYGEKPGRLPARLLVFSLAALLLLLGLWPEPLVYLSQAAAGALAGGSR